MRSLLVVMVLAGSASGEVRRPQVQIDGGLSVIGPAFEYPVTGNVALQVEAFVFGTYFLPWFDLGDRVAGVGGGIRPTWFSQPDYRGIYVAPYVRVASVGEDFAGDGVAVTAGAFVGRVLRLGKRWDLRLGGGVQYIYVDAGELEASTPFVAIDAVIGYRL